MAKHTYPTQFAPAAARTLDDIAAMVPPVVALGASSPPKRASLLRVYLAGAPHLKELAQRLGVPLVKIGLTEGSVWQRINGLSEQRYAGQWGTSAGSCSALDGADQWHPFRLDPTCRPIGVEHARVDDTGDIVLSIPTGIDRLALDAALTHVLTARNLRTFMASDEGRVRCSLHGVDQAAGFWTACPAQVGKPAKMQRAREIFILNPRTEVPLILRTLEAVAAHLVHHDRPATPAPSQTSSSRTARGG